MSDQKSTPIQRGYRIKLTVFVPITGDLDTHKKAIEFAQSFGHLPKEAPAGTVIERFETKPGQAKEES